MITQQVHAFARNWQKIIRLIKFKLKFDLGTQNQHPYASLKKVLYSTTLDQINSLQVEHYLC